jgi:hypothetical protein
MYEKPRYLFQVKYKVGIFLKKKTKTKTNKQKMPVISMTLCIYIVTTYGG